MTLSEDGTPVSESPSLLIIVATYNEIDSLPRLIGRLREELPAATLLVIDDASPDGTGNWCEQARQRDSRLHVIHREGKLGLGSAACCGFRWGLERDFDLIATMDADLSHDPTSMREMVEQMQLNTAGPAVLIGSRYVPGGGTEGWPWHRRLASRWVNRISRWWLGLPTRDNSGAFRVYNRAALEAIDLDRLTATDYAYLEEILWRMRRAGVTFQEHPIVFRNRELGRSKTSPWLGIKVIGQIMMTGWLRR